MSNNNVTWHANEMLVHETETETLDFLSETRPRLRPLVNFPRPIRDPDVTKIGLETVSRPRRRDRDYIPATQGRELQQQLYSTSHSSCLNVIVVHTVLVATISKLTLTRHLFAESTCRLLMSL